MAITGSGKSSVLPATNICCLTASAFQHHCRASSRTPGSKDSQLRNFRQDGNQRHSLVDQIRRKKLQWEFHSTWEFGKDPTEAKSLLRSIHSVTAVRSITTSVRHRQIRPAQIPA